MNIAEIDLKLADLTEQPFSPSEFPFRFLEIYDAAKSTISKLRQGNSNQSPRAGDILLKNKLFFRPAQAGNAAFTFDEMLADPLIAKHKPRFVIATDGVDFYARDQKVDQGIDIDFAQLSDQCYFFLPLAGIERHEAIAENQADIKATGKLSKLYDAILDANIDWVDKDHTHDLNVFMTRTLFCFFAEDTSIFENKLFTNTVMNRTNEDGSNTSEVLSILFEAMNTPKAQRSALPAFAKEFPYVNGKLFSEKAKVPRFSKRARRLLRECGQFRWNEINPDIFGSMIQAIVEPGMRGDMGMHYTSVTNIMKTINPLFLLSLEEEFEAGRDSAAKLNKLLSRIYAIRVFDPACGSGNFLIVAYRELRKLEMRIFERIKNVSPQWALPMSQVRLSQFYGIELTDFAAETAKLSLWIAEYQMNEQFREVFGIAPPTLPLKDAGNVVHGNATQIDWMDVCPPATRRVNKEKILDLATIVPVLAEEIIPDDQAETYIVGNPPYLGRAQQTKEQKADIIRVFSSISKKYKKLDYVACWMMKAADYCQKMGAQCALVTTNSICQGEQVALLWPHILNRNLEIGFAHQSFKWKNNAAKNAGVTCIVVGLRPVQKQPKRLYTGNLSRVVTNISPYLIEGNNLIVSPISNRKISRPQMDFGNMPRDDGNLSLDAPEKANLCNEYPAASRFCRRYFGSSEFIKGQERWCLWIGDQDKNEAAAIPPIGSRLAAVSKFRAASDNKSTADYALRSHRFVEIRGHSTPSIIIPRVSSERRIYLPVGILDETSIISDAAFAVYDPPTWLFGILSSRLHAVWTKAVGGKLKTDYRYSNTLVYNTFAIPTLSLAQQEMLEDHVFQILAAREAHPGKPLAWLYDPDTMPQNLIDAHQSLDDALETIYIGHPFNDDTERLEHLFKLYEAMIKKDQNNAKMTKSRVKFVENKVA